MTKENLEVESQPETEETLTEPEEEKVRLSAGSDRLWHLNKGDTYLGPFHTLSWAQHAANLTFPGVEQEVSRTRD